MKLIIIIIHINCSEILIIIKGFYKNLLIESIQQKNTYRS